MRKVSLPLLDAHLLADTFAEVPPEPPIDVVDKMAERIKATTPATCGPAMDVPLIQAYRLRV